MLRYRKHSWFYFSSFRTKSRSTIYYSELGLPCFPQDLHWNSVVCISYDLFPCRFSKSLNFIILPFLIRWQIIWSLKSPPLDKRINMTVSYNWTVNNLLSKKSTQEKLRKSLWHLHLSTTRVVTQRNIAALLNYWEIWGSHDFQQQKASVPRSQLPSS
jgi:hypothetical protein